jgi:hypothetical protein
VDRAERVGEEGGHQIHEFLGYGCGVMGSVRSQDTKLWSATKPLFRYYLRAPEAFRQEGQEQTPILSEEN